MIRIIRLTTALRDRTLHGATAERGVAMLTAIFFMVIVAGLSVVLMSVALSQQAPTYTAQKSTKTIYSAQAGLQAALGVMRTAAAAPNAEGEILGSPAKLPCTVAGTVDGGGTGTSYSVILQYFVVDPSGSDATWRTSNEMACSNGTGPAGKPKFAYITATGEGTTIPGQAASVGNRRLSAVYTFKVNNANVAGGQILSRDGAFCLHAISEAAGSEAKWIPVGACTDNDKQLWIYSKDYRLQLAKSTFGGAAGLCITGPVNDGENTQRATLQPCQPANSLTRWNQLWSWTGSYSWVGQKPTIVGGQSSYCLSPGGADGTNLSAVRLEVRKGGCSGTFLPTAQVGPGAASINTHQIVNFKEFGRCAAVTGANINSTFTISYPCKQDPTGTGTQLLWNHKWFYTEPPAGQAVAAAQEVYVLLNDNPAQRYCFTAPAAGGDTRFLPCNGSAAQKWVRVYNSGDYTSSYQFIDYKGRCLVADSTSTYLTWSQIKTAACNGSLEQKWNAPPIFVESDFGGYREVSE